MSKSPEARADRIIVSGPAANIPGMRGRTLGGMEQIHESGLLDLVAAVADQAPRMVPYGATVLTIQARVRVQNDAEAIVYYGTTADNDRFAALTIPNASPAGTVLTATLLNAGAILANSVVVWGANGGATAAGSVDAWAIWAAA